MKTPAKWFCLLWFSCCVWLSRKWSQWTELCSCTVFITTNLVGVHILGWVNVWDLCTAVWYIYNDKYLTTFLYMYKSADKYLCNLQSEPSDLTFCVSTWLLCCLAQSLKFTGYRHMILHTSHTYTHPRYMYKHTSVVVITTVHNHNIDSVIIIIEQF